MKKFLALFLMVIAFAAFSSLAGAQCGGPKADVAVATAQSEEIGQIAVNMMAAPTSPAASEAISIDAKNNLSTTNAKTEVCVTVKKNETLLATISSAGQVQVYNEAIEIAAYRVTQGARMSGDAPTTATLATTSLAKASTSTA
jgi:hypothetical protein